MKKWLMVLMVSLLVITLVDFAPLAFSQVILKDIKDHEFEFEIKKLVEFGIVKGFPDGTFRPEALITRAEAAVILAGIKKLSPVKPEVSPFKDVAPTHWAYGHIVAIQRAGLMKGYPDGTFRPSANILRAELAALLGQAKGLEKEAVKITEPLALANDEGIIPKWAIGWVTLGTFPEHQFLTYRRPRMTAPLAPATRGEVAYGAYMVHTPPVVGGEIKIGIGAEPTSLCQWFTTDALRWDINAATHSYSTYLDHHWDRYPQILREIPTVENGLVKVIGETVEITYRFRPRLKFSDGTPMTVDDWAYSFMVFMDRMVPVWGRTLEESIDFTKGVGAHGIKGFDILDAYSVKVYYFQIDYTANVFHPGGEAVLSRQVLEPAYKKMKETGVIDHLTKAENIARMPVQIGYFRQVIWAPGVRFVHERNPHSPFGRPLLDRVIYEVVPDTTARLAQVIAGALDISGITFDDAMVLDERIDALKKEGKVWHGRAWYVPGFFVENIFFNLENPLMADIRIRKAIAYGIDRQAMVDAFFKGRQKVAHSYIVPHHWAYSDDVVKYPYDPERAKALLEEAGWKVGPDGVRVKDRVRLTIELVTNSGHRTREMTQAIFKEQLKKVGIDLDISKNLPWAAYFARDHLFRRRFNHLAMHGMSPGILGVFDMRFRADSIPRAENAWTGSNFMAYENWEVNELYKAVRKEMSEPERKKLMAKLLRILSEELPTIPLYVTVSTFYSKHKIGNYTSYAWYYGHWWWRKDGKL